VLEHQLATAAPVHESELSSLIDIDTETDFDAAGLLEKIQKLSNSGDV